MVSLSSLICRATNFSYSFDFGILNKNFNNKYINRSGTYFSNESTIIIFGNDGWELASNNNWCEGNGTIDNPYIIKNITLRSFGAGYCLRIRDSDVFFIIKNCTFSNASFGIILVNVQNGKLTGNKLYNNTTGIYLQNCYHLNITSNSMYCNFKYGVNLYGSDNNLLNGNFIAYNLGTGINLDFSDNNTVLRNIGNFNGDSGVSVSYFCINNVLIENYFSFNKADGITLRFWSNFNNISGNEISNNNMNGISLIKCNNLTISKNWIYENKNYGINFESSNFSIVVGNKLLNNKDCIYEKNSYENVFEDNYPCYYGELKEINLISGYLIYFFIMLFCIFTCIIVRKTKMSYKYNCFQIKNT